MNFSTTRPRNRATILADINAAQPAVAGTLTSKTRTLKNGQTATYYQVQRWDKAKKRNITTHVPQDKVEQVRAAIEQHRRFEALALELAQADIAGILDDTPRPQQPDLKKKRCAESPSTRGKSAKPSAARSTRLNKTARA